MSNTHYRITNTSNAQVYTSDLAGRQYLVVPSVAIVEGVMNGELVTMAEVEATLEAWNGRPVIIRHPADGQSASTIRNFIEHNIGMLFNPRIDGQSFKVDMFIDIEKAEKLGEGGMVLQRLQDGEILEVSTGYWAHSMEGGGEYNGEAYSARQHNIVPDHLAILIDERGACSIADGCGAPRLNRGERSMDDVRFLLTNEDISHNELYQLLATALGMGEDGPWIVDVFDDRVIYESPTANGWVLQMRDYTRNDDGVELGDEVKTVRQRSVYVENAAHKAGFFEKLASAILKRNATDEKETRMDKIEMILNRQGCPFTRDELEAMPEPVLDKLTTLNSEVAPEPTPAPADRTDEVLSAIGAMSARIDQLEKQQKAVETAEVASVTNALVKAGVEVEKLEGMTLPQLHLLQNALSPSYSGVPAPGQRHYEPLDEFEELAMPSLNGVEA